MKLPSIELVFSEIYRCLNLETTVDARQLIFYSQKSRSYKDFRVLFGSRIEINFNPIWTRVTKTTYLNQGGKIAPHP